MLFLSPDLRFALVLDDRDTLSSIFHFSIIILFSGAPARGLDFVARYH